MQTIEMTQEEMGQRVARFRDLKPLAVQDNPNIPLEAKDVIYSRTIYSVIGLEGVTTPSPAHVLPIVNRTTIATATLRLAARQQRRII